MKVIVSDFQADCLTTGRRESRKKAFQDVDPHSSSENHRFNHAQLTLTASPEGEAVSSAIISKFIKPVIPPPFVIVAERTIPLRNHRTGAIA